MSPCYNISAANIISLFEGLCWRGREPRTGGGGRGCGEKVMPSGEGGEKERLGEKEQK